MKTIYMVSENADSMEGRGPMLPRFTTSDIGLARNYVMARPGIGGKHTKVEQYGNKESFGPWSISPITLLETRDDFDNYPKAMAVTAALAKLSAADRSVLGLTAEVIDEMLMPKR